MKTLCRWMCFPHSCASLNLRINGASVRFAAVAIVTVLLASSAGAQSSSDKRFVVYAAQANLNAMAVDQLAAQKANNADVKNFAQQMVNEHEDMNSTVAPFAKEWGVTLPTAADAATQNEVAKLNGLSGAAFDKEYLSYLVKDHDAAYKKFKTEASETKDVPFRDSVSTSRDRLNDHKTQAEALEKKL